MKIKYFALIFVLLSISLKGMAEGNSFLKYMFGDSGCSSLEDKDCSTSPEVTDSSPSDKDLEVSKNLSKTGRMEKIKNRRFSYIGGSLYYLSVTYPKIMHDKEIEIFGEKLTNKSSLFGGSSVGVEAHFGMRINRFFGGEMGVYANSFNNKELSTVRRSPLPGEAWGVNGTKVKIKTVEKTINSWQSTNGANLDLHFYMPLTPHFEPFIVAGVASNMTTVILRSETRLIDSHGTEYSYSDGDRESKATEHGVGGRLGIGAQYIFDSRASLRLQSVWQSMDVTNTATIKDTNIKGFGIYKSNYTYLTFNVAL